LGRCNKRVELWKKNGKINPNSSAEATIYEGKRRWGDK